MSPTPARAAIELQMLERLVDGAYGLGVAFCEAAKAETDRDAKLALFDAFQRASLAVRMGIRLSLSLRTAPKPAAAPGLERLERERPDAAERLDIEPIESEPIERERDREREYEPVSLPRFLATLGVVADQAERLPVEVTRPALPALRELLVQARPHAAARPVAASSVPAVAALTRPLPPAQRSALLGSAAAPGRLSGLPRPPRSP